jgi:hypothetical protein
MDSEQVSTPKKRPTRVIILVTVFALIFAATVQFLWRNHIDTGPEDAVRRYLDAWAQANERAARRYMSSAALQQLEYARRHHKSKRHMSGFPEPDSLIIGRDSIGVVCLSRGFADQVGGSATSAADFEIGRPVWHFWNGDRCAVPIKIEPGDPSAQSFWLAVVKENGWKIGTQSELLDSLSRHR